MDGDLDELDEESWRELPIAPAAPPQDWNGPLDHLDTEPEDAASDLSGVQLPDDSQEAWEQVTAEDEIDLLTEQNVAEDFKQEDESGQEDAGERSLDKETS